MTKLRDIGAVLLLALATLAGISGIGQLFTTVTDHLVGGFLWGLPLALGGLYWCGRALAQSQRLARRRWQMRRAGSPVGAGRL